MPNFSIATKGMGLSAYRTRKMGSSFMEGRYLEEGDKVEFKIDSKGKRGPRAINVKRVEEREGEN